MYAIEKDKVIDAFRAAVLKALDETAHEIFGPNSAKPLPKSAGATDGDLPHLFRCIDAHVNTLATRHGAALVDYPTPAWLAEKAG